MKQFAFAFVAVVALVAAGCQSGAEPETASASEPATAELVSGDIATHAAVSRVAGAADQYRTDLRIERVGADGSRRLLASPSVASRAGEPASMAVEAEGRTVSVRVLVPEPAQRGEGVDVRVSVEEAGHVLASPRLRLPVPG